MKTFTIYSVLFDMGASILAAPEIHSERAIISDQRRFFKHCVGNTDGSVCS